LRIRPQTLQVLESQAARIADSSTANYLAERIPPPTLVPAVRAELRLIMEQIVICLSERRLRMLDYLEDLKR
jgi:hypothetical protein